MTPQEKALAMKFMGGIYGATVQNDQNIVEGSEHLQPRIADVQRQLEQVYNTQPTNQPVSPITPIAGVPMEHQIAQGLPPQPNLPSTPPPMVPAPVQIVTPEQAQMEMNFSEPPAPANSEVLERLDKIIFLLGVLVENTEEPPCDAPPEIE